MKILKRPNTDWSMKHTCSQCTAELEVEKGDVKFTSYPGDFREPGYETWTATCPFCSNVFHIKEATLPKAVQIEIKKNRSDNGPYGGGGYYDR